MYCLHCGNQINESSAQCPYCGAPVAAQTVPSAPASQEAYPTMPQQQVQQPQQPYQPQPQAQDAPTQQPYYDQGAYGQQVQPGPYAQLPAPATPASKKKRNRIIIAAAAAFLVIALGVGGYFGITAFIENQRSNAYAQAAALMEQGSYAEALEGFVALDDYQDSEGCAQYCSMALEYEAAVALMESENHAEARDAFFALGDFMGADDQVILCDGWLAFEDARALTEQGLYEEAALAAEGFKSINAVRDDPQVAAWRNKNDYGRAELLLANGQLYDAYLRFGKLGTYEDAAARAQACMQQAPGTGVIYHNEGFRSSSTDVVFEAGLATVPHYLKLYSGDTLVSTLFVNPNSTATISIPAGDYTIKSASGAAWFGEGDMFGDDGTYNVLLFDGGSENVFLDNNKIYTITLVYEGGGNVGGSSVKRGSF